MRITAVATEVRSYSPAAFGFKRPLGNVTRQHASFDYILVKVQSDEGTTGLGYAFTPGYGTAVIRTAAEQDLTRLALGQDPCDHEALWDRMWQGTNYFGRQGAVLFGIAAIDIACWDLDARSRGVPLHQVLGGPARPVEIYVTFGFASLTPRELQQLAEQYVEQGFTRLKLMVGLRDGDADVARVRAVRQAAGPGVEVVADANQAWPDAATALRRAPRLIEAGIGWLEEPVPADDVRGLAEVRHNLEVPIAGGENAYTWLQARELLEREAVDVFQPDVYRMGGLTEHVRVCRRVLEAGVRLAPHHVPELNVHVLSALGCDGVLEYVPFFQDPALTGSWRGAGPRTSPGEAPGHGLEFRPAPARPRTSIHGDEAGTERI